MITQMIGVMDNVVLPLNFFCNFIIFLGGFYVVLHSRNLPHWITTCLWYIGLCSLFTSITIGIDWIWGPEFPMSYTNIGLLGETASLIALTITVFLLFSKTIMIDYRNKKNRKQSSD
jgi:hypothetical protein